MCAFVCVPDSSPYLSWLHTTPSPVCVKIVIHREIDGETEAERKGHTCIEIVANAQNACAQDTHTHTHIHTPAHTYTKICIMKKLKIYNSKKAQNNEVLVHKHIQLRCTQSVYSGIEFMEFTGPVMALNIHIHTHTHTHTHFVIDVRGSGNERL